MLLALLVWGIAAVTAVLFVIKRWWFPGAINAHARAFDDNFRLTLWLVGGIFLAAQLILGWVILRYRRQDREASQSEGNNTLEWIWTTAALALFVGVTVISTSIWADVHFEKPSAGALQIEALGKQFAFSFRYPGADGKFGSTDVKQINDANGNPFGVDERDPAGKDDITSATLRVPVNASVVLVLKSRDVIHNFFVRELRLKQDLVPGMDIPLAFTAEKTGQFEVACSELCGLGHHQMRTMLIVLGKDEYDAWQRQMLDQLRGLQGDVR